MRYLTEKNASLSIARSSPSRGGRSGDVEISFNDLLLTLHKRRWIIIRWTVAMVAIAVLAYVLITPKYESTATLEVNPESSDMLHFEGATGANMMPGVEGYEFNVALTTEGRVIESDELALQVARELKLESRAPFAPKQSLLSWLPSLPSMAPTAPVDWNAPLEQSPARREAFLQTYHKLLMAKPQSGTRMIQVINKNPDPQLSAQIVNTLVNDYLESRLRTRFAATSQASEWLGRELKQLKKEYETAQEDVVNYQRKNGMLALGPEEGHDIVTAKLVEQNTQVTTAEGNRVLKEAAYKLSQTGDPEIVSAFAGGDGADQAKGAATLLFSLRDQRTHLESQKAELLARFGPAYPRVMEVQQELRDVDAEIDTETGKVIRRLKAEYEASLDSENMLRSSLEKQKQEAYQMNDRAVQYTVLKHEADARRDLYDSLEKKLTETGVLARLRSSNVQVVDSAAVASLPSSPNPTLFLAASLAFGLFGGVASAFVAENMDETLTTPEQVEANVHLAALGIVPNDKSSGGILKLFSRSADRNTPRIWLKPISEMAESYRGLRVSLLYPGPEHMPASIAITSALPKEGKTTTAMNLAATLAQHGLRVLLMEADMRNPSLARKMNLKAGLGLSDVLTGKDSASDCIKPYEQVPGLSVLLAGRRPANPALLLASEGFHDLMEDMKKKFDTVIVDTPPILAVSDAVFASLSTDCLLLVARFGVTSKQNLVRARDTLYRANVAISGVIVNRTDTRSSDYGHYGKFTSRYYAEKGV